MGLNMFVSPILNTNNSHDFPSIGSFYLKKHSDSVSQVMFNS